MIDTPENAEQAITLARELGKRYSTLRRQLGGAADEQALNETLREITLNKEELLCDFPDHSAAIHDAWYVGQKHA